MIAFESAAKAVVDGERGHVHDLLGCFDKTGPSSFSSQYLFSLVKPRRQRLMINLALTVEITALRQSCLEPFAWRIHVVG